MILHPSECVHDQKVYDVCIVGSGPAGITLALELQYADLSICVVESGLEWPSEEMIPADVDSTSGIRILRESRELGLGGTSRTWSGFIAPLDPIDIASRNGLHDGWPIAWDEVAHALEDAGGRYGFPPLRHFEDDPAAPATAKLPSLHNLARKTFLVQSPPFRYGVRFRYAFTGSQIDLLLDATAVSLEYLDGDGAAQVSCVNFRTSRGVKGRVRSRFFVLAAGAIETVRILFNSSKCGASLGDGHGQLGRYFMNHPKGYVGNIRFRRALPPGHEVFRQGHADLKGFDRYVGVRLDERLQTEGGLTNCYLRLEPLKGEINEHAGGRTFARHVRDSLRHLRARQIKAALKAAVGAARHAGHLPAAAVLVARRLKKPTRSEATAARVRCFVDMAPRAENRILASGPNDGFGTPTAVVSHSLGERDFVSAKTLIDEFAKASLETGLGEFVPSDAPLHEILSVDASHHLGGARMGVDPVRSVVDESLKVHGVDNLYVAGGAVFPTGGCANPTMTMAGLSIRLAARLKQVATPGGFEPPQSNRQGDGVIIIGAGRRVAEDVVPVIEALAPFAHVQGIYATRPGVVFGRTAPFDVWPLDLLDGSALSQARAVYVAVPPAAVGVVLSKLTPFDRSRLHLIVDTPAVDLKALRGAYDGYARVHVAEDSFYLPWLPLITKAFNSSAIRRVEIERAAYRYHAYALAKALAQVNGGPRRTIARSSRRGNVTSITFDGGATLRLVQPRDYKAGVLRIELCNGVIVSSASEERGGHLSCMVEGLKCVGFRLNGAVHALEPWESDLIGKMTPEDTIVTRMLDLKRLGLHQLLTKALAGLDTYTLADGLDDARVARRLH